MTFLASVLTLLELATGLLTAVQSNPNINPAQRAAATSVANNAILVATQYLAQNQQIVSAVSPTTTPTLPNEPQDLRTAPAPQQPIIIEPEAPVIDPNSLAYGQLTHTISSGILPFDGTSIATVSLTVKSKSGTPMAGKIIQVTQRNCYCLGNSGGEQFYSDTFTTDSNGNATLNIKAHTSYNNFLEVVVKDSGGVHESKMIPIPTSFEGKVWRWSQAEGGYFENLP